MLFIVCKSKLFCAKRIVKDKETKKVIWTTTK